MWSSTPISEIFRNHTVHSIILIGKTGTGKSTIANRLTLDFGLNGDEGVHKANNKAKSCTTKIQHTAVVNRQDMFVIVDTPGLADSEGRDNEFIAGLFKYFTAFSVNKKVICMPILKGSKRLDYHLKCYLELLYVLFGKEIWSHLYLIVSYCDDPIPNEDLQEFDGWKKDFTNEAKIQLVKYGFETIPILTIGKRNYGLTIKALYDAALLAKNFESEFAKRIVKFNLSKDLLERNANQQSLLDFVKEELEKKENAEIKKNPVTAAFEKVASSYCIVM